MITIIGIVVVLGAVIGGFAFINGPMHVLFQPGELIIIGGAAVGSLLISAPGKALGQVGKGFVSAFLKPYARSKTSSSLSSAAVSVTTDSSLSAAPSPARSS
jgi:chemotaxis protein MotA